ncbi:MAG TPA: TetR/AcrR family transcriptional regulator [Leptospiraceae bacterium]|nr:TetR/AcrR family transcriptional regulator [Leptospiraceae bacterium]HMY67015.1 TetR/AcrR family transcriptional regulator [Leptospiraceae bacterium]HNF16035.1 TetR/AcrR family transcriptional regulator [Leptospiraceae bacterium]HNI99873.1 TetR/AcrR family transcriptional regulator [Leptospiraceae bacterium]HNM06036.1 TetR/AcrR family transcriptional regulator [Leptospiraceae bacterium]
MPKIVDHESYRESLLEKAFELFARKGYEITMRELAREMDVSTGTLYHYFSNKEEIFKQTMSYISRKQIQILIDRIGKYKDKDEKVKNMFQYILNNEKFFQNTLFLIIDYYRQNGSTDPDNIIRDMADFYKSSISDQLGVMNKPLVSTFLSFTLGILLHRILDPSAGDFDVQVSIVRSLMLFVSSDSKVA